jgi:putative membrane protein
VVERLPDLIAALNALAFVFLFLGWRAIKAKQIERHRAMMLSAVACSSLFLVAYLSRWALTGHHAFTGEGFIRTAYLTILFSHMVLAVVVVPLVLRSLFLGWRDDRVAHKRIARVTLPIWAYVSVTGVVVYWMLNYL